MASQLPLQCALLHVGRVIGIFYMGKQRNGAGVKTEPRTVSCLSAVELELGQASLGGVPHLRCDLMEVGEV